jgi:hypothetical protein
MTTMKTDALTPALLKQLRTPLPGLALSLTMPTHRREPDNAQDPVRLRNLVARAERRLTEDPAVPREERLAVKAQLERAAAEVDLKHALDGLVVFASAEEWQIWSLPRWVPERVVVSDSYLTRNLVAAKAQAHPYWVLSLTSDRARLLSGIGEHLVDHGADGFPRAALPDLPDAQRTERIGDTPSTFQDEQTRHFMRQVHADSCALLTADPRPLYLVGLPQAVTLFEDIGSGNGRAAGHLLKGGLIDSPGHALVQELAPAFDEAARHRVDAASGRLDAARGRRAFAAGLDEVWQAVQEGRAELVVVEEHFHTTVAVNDGHLEPISPDEAGPTAREDIVDELVENALDRGTEVVFLPDETLTEHHRIAAVLRY